MSLEDSIYLVDNNCLTRLDEGVRGRAEFRSRCRIPSEVLHEASGYPDIEMLKSLEIPMDIHVLRALDDVMAEIAPGQVDVVDLYRNQGNADPLLVATALVLQERWQGGLWETTVHVATEDKAVRGLAERFGVSVVSFDELRSALSGG